MKPERKLLIIGASGHGKVIADLAEQLKVYSDITFLDDDENVTICLGYPVIGKVSEAKSYIKTHEMTVAIGNNITRGRIMNELIGLGATLPTLIHPKAIISPHVSFGEGSVIVAGTIINAATSIGKGCILNTGCTVDHDNTLGDFVHISPGAHLAGGVTIGDYAWIGMGAIIKQEVLVGQNAVVGMGSVVIKEIPNNNTVVGVPARVIKVSKE
mgnify:CR=1 FL=1